MLPALPTLVGSVSNTLSVSRLYNVESVDAHCMYMYTVSGKKVPLDFLP